MDAALLAPTWASGPVDVRCPSDDVDALLGVLTQHWRRYRPSFRIEVGRAVVAALVDGEPTQPAPRRPQPGWVVTKFERASDELDGLIGAWAAVRAEKQTPAQVARTKAALAGWRESIGGGVVGSSAESCQYTIAPFSKRRAGIQAAHDEVAVLCHDHKIQFERDFVPLDFGHLAETIYARAHPSQPTANRLPGRSMAHLITARRTGPLIVGVVPPSGIPLPQYTSGFGYWVGSPAELGDRTIRATLLTLTKLRKELRLGRLRKAAALAAELLPPGEVPLDAETERSIAVLAAANAAWTSTKGPEAAAQLDARLAKLPDPLPAMLLDVLLDPAATIGPEQVEAALERRCLSTADRTRLRLLLLRRAALDFEAQPSVEAKLVLERRAASACHTQMHPNLMKWAQAVLHGAGKKDLLPLLAALGPNLPLADPATHRLFEAVSGYFAQPGLDSVTRRKLSRATFSAWTTLLALEGSTAAPALVSFAGVSGQLRSVAELLLDQSLRFTLAQERPELALVGSLGVASQGAAPLELRAWYGLLFAGVRDDAHEPNDLRRWFAASARLAPLREGERLRHGLSMLLEARLDSLALDESNAAQSTLELWQVVRVACFGVTKSTDLPKPGAGLFGMLLKVISWSSR